METAIAETGTMTMAALLSTITEVFTAATGWMASVAEIVVANPLFLIPIVFTFIAPDLREGGSRGGRKREPLCGKRLRRFSPAVSLRLFRAGAVPVDGLLLHPDGLSGHPQAGADLQPGRQRPGFGPAKGSVGGGKRA